MQVIRAKTAGFCFGVSHALKLLDQEIDRLAARVDQSSMKPRIITLGPIIHNPLVMESYAQKGVICTDDIKQIRPGDHVIIRAHGIPLSLENQLRTLGAVIVDATCPKVKAAQNAIAEQSKTPGNTLLLFGEADHPEVRGLVSYANEGALVFESLEELRTLTLQPDTHYFLAAQTTQDKRLLPDIIDYLKSTCGNDAPVLNTICNATRNRQDEVVELAGQVEGMVVVGGLNSGNTKRLAEIAKASGIPTIHIEDIETFSPDALQDIRVVGLTAGASTPKKHIDAMENLLQTLE